MVEEVLNRTQEVEQTLQEFGFENYLVYFHQETSRCTISMLRENQDPKEIDFMKMHNYLSKSEVVICECENGEWVVIKNRQCIKKPLGTLSVILSNLRTYNFS